MFKSDRVIICVVFALLTIGVVMVYSSSFILAERAGPYPDGYFFFKKHLTGVLISILALLLLKEIPYQTWSKLNPVILIIMFLLLVAVFIPGLGRTYYGAHRWIKLGPINFQPSEFAKLGLIIYLTSFISKQPERIRDFKKGLIPLFMVIGLSVGLIMAEPDIGTALFLSIVCGMVLFISGIKLQYFLPLVAGAVLLIMIIAFLFFPHVVSRLQVFLNPAADTLGKSYQINQALIGLGAGGATGAGLGLSKQKLFFLPQQHTDFVMAIIGEEIGFVGTFMVLVLFLLLFLAGWRLFRHSSDHFGGLLSLGITLLITIQALINLSVVTASLPTKGIGLPFISFGGSALIATMCGVGILINIARQSEKVTAKYSKS